MGRKIYGLTFIMCFFVIAFFLIKKQIKHSEDLKLKGRYAIGETKGWIHNHRSSKFSLYYTYSYMGTIYKETTKVLSISKIVTKGGKYMVLFDPENPKNSKLLLDIKVCGCYLQNYRDTGWIKIPDFVVLCEKDRDSLGNESPSQ